MSELTKRTIEAHQLYSAHLQENRTVKVCLPVGYDASTPHAVLYVHDGLEFFTHGRIATIANELIVAGKIMPLVIVGIAVQMSTRNDDYAPTGKRVDAYMQFVVDEVLPWVEMHYAVRRDVGGRFLGGVSLGGAVSLQTALTYPTVFHKLVLFSGAFYEPLQDHVKQQVDLSWLASYMVVGEDEQAIETPRGTFDFLRFNQQMRDSLQLRGAHISYQQGPGKHLWGFWQSHMVEALSWLSSQIKQESH